MKFDYAIEANRKRWDELAELHFSDSDYDVKGFLEGKNLLKELELKELVDVNGKSMLHLQCHFGLDSLSWARLGAKVTGIDFSEKAILKAQQLAKEIDVDAEFVVSDMSSLIENMDDEKFDIVFTSYGVLYWLPDLASWAKVVSHFLKPGGTFYIAEAHPIGNIFNDEIKEPKLEVMYDYFKQEKPHKFEEDGSYANPDAKLENKTEYGWNHSIGEIINSLIDTGLEIEFFNEHEEICWQQFPWLKLKKSGMYTYPDDFKGAKVPLTFSLMAKKK